MTLNWTRSTFCASQACVEVADHDGVIFLRDGKDRDGAVLRFSREEWRDFVNAVAADEFR